MTDRILVVDDDFLTLEQVSGILNRAECNVTVASDEKSAMTAFRRVKPHLAVIGEIVNDMSGLCKKMRQRSSVPIILLSPLSGETNVVLALRSGADDYIEKPFRPDELLARVQAHLRRSRMTTPNEDYTLRFGWQNELVIDPEQRSVMVCGSLADLTKTEFEVLLYLAQHKDHILSAEEIHEHVWKSDLKVNKGNVRWYIWRLRDKLHRLCSDPDFIKTEHSVGYKFAVTYQSDSQSDRL